MAPVLRRSLLLLPVLALPGSGVELLLLEHTETLMRNRATRRGLPS